PARPPRRLARDGFVIFHDLAMPGSDVNVDHLVIGPTGVFVIDSKQWTGQVHQTADGLAWHNHYALTAPSTPWAGKPRRSAGCSAPVLSPPTGRPPDEPCLPAVGG